MLPLNQTGALVPQFRGFFIPGEGQNVAKRAFLPFISKRYHPAIRESHFGTNSSTLSMCLHELEIVLYNMHGSVPPSAIIPNMLKNYNIVV